MSGRDVLGIALAYGPGCLCAGYYVVRWRTGTDVRRSGSSSAGARNAGRVLGRGGFARVLALDALKGVAAVWAACAIGLAGAAVAVVAGRVLPVQAFGLAYLLSSRRLVPSGLSACALAPLTGVLLHRSCVELAVLVALALVILVAHRDNLRAALQPARALS